LYAIKDKNDSSSFELDDLVDTTVIGSTPPDLSVDNGWYFLLPQGEKALAESIVFNKILYATTFLPNDDACTPGGYAKLYKTNYLINNNNIGEIIGGGIPSKPVIVITKTGKAKLLISVGSTNPNPDSPDTGAGVTKIDVDTEKVFILKWWRELFN